MTRRRSTVVTVTAAASAAAAASDSVPPPPGTQAARRRGLNCARAAAVGQGPQRPHDLAGSSVRDPALRVTVTVHSAGHSGPRRLRTVTGGRGPSRLPVTDSHGGLTQLDGPGTGIGPGWPPTTECHWQSAGWRLGRRTEPTGARARPGPAPPRRSGSRRAWAPSRTRNPSRRVRQDPESAEAAGPEGPPTGRRRAGRRPRTRPPPQRRGCQLI